MKTARHSLLSLMVAGLALPLALAGCSTHESGGALDVALVVAPGITINDVGYTISGPASFSKSGTIPVGDSPTIAASIGGIPPATGYTIALSATATDGATCAGSSPIDVTAGAATAVTVHLTCHEPPHTGGVLVNGQLNLCPIADGIAANPGEVFVGGSISLGGFAHDADQGPAPLSFLWTSTGGTLTDASALNAVLTCTSPGPVTVTLTISDGDPAPGCAAALSATVTCTATGTGSGGSAGTAGAPGAGGTTGTAGTTGAAGAPGAGGTTGTAGTTGAAGSTGAGGTIATGDVVVYRVGDGTTALVNTGSPVFIDEYTPTGTLVKTSAMPTSANGINHRLIASGTATSEGLITRSTDGRFVLLTGYDAAIPTSGLASTSSTTNPRVIGRLDASGNVDTSTALTDAATGNNPRSAASADGTTLWLTGGAGGIRSATFGGTTSVQLSTTVTNLREVGIFASQLYVTDSSGSAVRLGTVGTGVPTTAPQTITTIPGFATSTGSPYGFFFAALDPSTSSPDVLYVADDSVGLTKYSLVGGSWTANGTIGAGSDAYRGVTGVVSGSSVILFAVRGGGSGATGGGQLVSLTDTTGYNGAFAGAPATLATAANQIAFRGVALAPTP